MSKRSILTAAAGIVLVAAAFAVLNWVRALERSKNHQYAAALPDWQTAVKLGPAEPLAHNNLGVALAETGRFDEAIPHYLRAIELDPKYPEPHNNLGMALIAKKRLGEAAQSARAALAVADGQHNIAAAEALKLRIAAWETRRPAQSR